MELRQPYGFRDSSKCTLPVTQASIGRTLDFPTWGLLLVPGAERLLSILRYYQYFMTGIAIITTCLGQFRYFITVFDHRRDDLVSVIEPAAWKG